MSYLGLDNSFESSGRPLNLEPVHASSQKSSLELGLLLNLAIGIHLCWIQNGCVPCDVMPMDLLEEENHSVKFILCA